MLNREMSENLFGMKRPVYAWRVDKFLIADGVEIEPTGTVKTGPGAFNQWDDADYTAQAALLKTLAEDPNAGEKFRMLDGDDLPYMEGRIMFADEADNGSGAGDMHEAPLWDLGEGYGCIEIQYRVKTDAGGTKWEAI